MSDASTPITSLLSSWSAGEPGAFQALMELAYDDLRAIAHRRLAAVGAGETLGTTALVHEAFLRLVDQREVRWQNRAHFFGISARVMRRVLVDFARERGYRKRGGGTLRVPLDEALLVAEAPDEDLVALDAALDALAQVDARKSRAIELRFFGGLTTEETALVLDVSPDTVKRDWRLAKAWLKREMRGDHSHDA